MQVRELMTTPVIAVRAETPLKDDGRAARGAGRVGCPSSTTAASSGSSPRRTSSSARGAQAVSASIYSDIRVRGRAAREEARRPHRCGCDVAAGDHGSRRRARLDGRGVHCRSRRQQAAGRRRPRPARRDRLPREPRPRLRYFQHRYAGRECPVRRDLRREPTASCESVRTGGIAEVRGWKAHPPTRFGSKGAWIRN